MTAKKASAKAPAKEVITQDNTVLAKKNDKPVKVTRGGGTEILVRVY